MGGVSILRCSSESSRRNSAKLSRNFGRRDASEYVIPLRGERKGAAEKRPKRLFTKNTGLCQADEAMYRV